MLRHTNEDGCLSRAHLVGLSFHWKEMKYREHKSRLWHRVAVMALPEVCSENLEKACSKQLTFAGTLCLANWQVVEHVLYTDDMSSKHVMWLTM